MVRRKYILSRNKKARSALLEMGATLTPGTFTEPVDATYYNVDSITYDVLYVSGNCFDDMSSKQFSRFLRRNKLSLYQKD